MTCYLFCNKTIHFEVENSIGSLLGFPAAKLEANKWHESTSSVTIYQRLLKGSNVISYEDRILTDLHRT